MPRRPPQPRIQTTHLPAPLGGLNTVSPASQMPPTDCASVWNLIPGDKGLDVRPGFAEWVTGLTGGITDEVRSLLSFAGSIASKNRLFAVTSSGIYDVTDSGTAPALSLGFASRNGDAGYGVAKVVVTAAGHFLLYCDEENGLHVYTESTDTWAAVTMGGGAGQISGVDPADLVHVGVFKNRVWFAERESTSGWYLDTNAIYGAATEFDFGAQFKAGGTLVGTWNWTYDGGGGLDDSLVARSSGGDLVIYQGTDPASINTFSMKGTWQVGDTLRGRRVMTDRGGDVLVMSRLGLLPLSRLVVGAATADASLYATAKINNLFVSLAAQYGDAYGWSIQIHPTTNALLITLPNNGTDIEQLAFSFATNSWWPWRDLPILSACTWNGELYFGTRDGRVCRNTGAVDDLKDADNYSSIGWSVLPAYQNLGRPTQKQLQSVRPIILAGLASANVQATAKYGFDLSEPTEPTGVGGGGSNAWDTAVWDSAVWQGDCSTTAPILGASGMGREVSVALQGNAIAPTTLVGIDLMYTEGGPL